MKTKRSSKLWNKFKLEKQFPIGKANWSFEQQLKEAFLHGMAAQPTRHAEKSHDNSNMVNAYEKALASIATNAWKAKSRLKDAAHVKDGGILKKIDGDLDRIFNVIEQGFGWEIKGHTGKDYDYGMALKVVTTQPMANIHRERVIETIKPTIYDKNDKNRIIQIGAVVIATPA